ncbi:hypothetical protein F4806DRAFT_250896 [Annulohypoxylon nitens]|nr:hypothetical protein F4806DRAFT_250896 [Annulohypoxylon nitens]
MSKDNRIQTPKSKSATYTISADRTCDSPFECESQILEALRLNRLDDQHSNGPFTIDDRSFEPRHSYHADVTSIRRGRLVIFRGIPGGGRYQSTKISDRISKEVPDSLFSGVTFDGTMSRINTNSKGNSHNQLQGSSTNHKLSSRTQQTILENEHISDSQYRSPTISNSVSDNDFEKIARTLKISHESVIDLKSLQAYILDLQATRIHEPPDLRSRIIYRVNSPDPTNGPQMYLDKPQWVDGANEKKEILMGNVPIRDIASYLHTNTEVCFIVYRDFLDPSTMKKYYNDAISDPKWQSESIDTSSPVLDTALTKFMNSQLFDTSIVENPKSTVDLSSDVLGAGFLEAPYPAFYHAQGEMVDSFLESLHPSQKQQFKVLLDYILSQYKEEYDVVREMTANGRINRRYLRYLFRPEEVVVQSKGDIVRGFLCNSWVTKDSHFGEKKTLSGKAKEVEKYAMSARHWVFDGAFLCKTVTLKWEINADDTSDMEIDGLDVYPLSYAKQDLVHKLRRRGEMIWKCRTRHLVSYCENTSREPHNPNDGRYIIDMAMYRQLHANKNSGKAIHASSSMDECQEQLLDELAPKAMEQDEPPFDKFMYLLPTKIKGFNLRKKRWLDLDVDNLGDVVWNTRAFESLVLEESTKELIQALVSNQTETERSTDVISGKGNGLILLLHGGPGTGKTLTAESVAEIARRPLYPVTCGDIGTEPEAVENYLESVLHLGKTWGCVVLLDEADVFLEQRSLEDLRRNALVSVFLRVLEYYEGILILTSNRVGTFDEAFKSRIQLSIHYKNLNAEDRALIWANFIERLKELGEEGIDFKDLERNIMILANYSMNGREIRNIISLARQYTRWKRSQHQNPGSYKLNFATVKSIIQTAHKFDHYIKQLNGGFSPDQIAEGEGLRLADDAAKE